MIKVTLHGSFEARCDAYGLHQRAKRHGVIDALARRLLRAGAPPGQLLGVFRDGTLCFKPVPLKAWADRRLLEHDVHGFRVRPYQEWNSDLLKE